MKIKRATRTLSRDRQIAEFDKKDLGADLAKSGAGAVIRRSRVTSITLDNDLIDKLRKAGQKRGLGYQTMLKVILRENLKKY